MKKIFQFIFLFCLMILFQNCEFVSERSSISATNEPGLDGTLPENPLGNNEEVLDIPPSLENQNLPLGGLFYGSKAFGFHTGNGRISVQSARRFRAEKTGLINAVRYNNRTLKDINITGRCTANDPDSVWCRCVDAGLDRYTCGYTLGNSYSVGNGGSIIVEVREDDGTPLHEPKSGEPLARTAVPFVPLDNANEEYPILELASPAPLEFGKMYHLVFVNLNPPQSCGLGGQSLAAARNCPRNQGAMGLNGVSFSQNLDGEGVRDPFRGSSAENMHRQSDTDAWVKDPDNLSWYEVRYSDGVWAGDSYAAFASSFEGKQSIGGNKVGRQVFEVEDADRVVTGLWVNYGHNGDRPSDGTNLQVILKNSNGEVLDSGEIQPNAFCITQSESSSVRTQNCRVWSYTPFEKSHRLELGESYSVEFRGGGSGGYALSTYFPLNYGPYQSEDRNHWSNAHAEISTDGGSTWELWAGNYYSERDIPMLFSIEGMPVKMP